MVDQHHATTGRRWRNTKGGVMQEKNDAQMTRGKRCVACPKIRS